MINITPTQITKFLFFILLFNVTASQAKMTWKELSNEQQKILLPFESSWNSLEDTAKNKLVINTNKWLDMTPEQRMESRKKLHRFKNLTPQERRQLKHAKNKFQHLSPKEKARLRKKYQQLSPEERKRSIRRYNKKQKQKKFIAKFDIEIRKPIAEMFKNLKKTDRTKFRRYLKDLSPKERHNKVLNLLRMQPKQRSLYIQSL